MTVKPSSGIAEKLVCDIVTDRKINLTIEKAYQFLELDTFQGERQVNERHVQALYNAFSSGRFMWEHVNIAICNCEGKTYRLNGQHTCWMRVNAPKDIDAMVREITYSVKDEAALRALYSTFDQNKQRTPGHIMKALLVGTPVAADVWPSIIGILSAGLKFWLYEKAKSGTALTVTVPDIAQIITFKYPDLFKQVGLFMQSQYDTYIPSRRKSVIAAMFATFSASPPKAVEFWRPVCEALGFAGKDDARWQLRRFLDTHRVSSKGTASSGNICNEEDLYRICINAWNKWRKGEAVQSLRPTDKRLKAV